MFIGSRRLMIWTVATFATIAPAAPQLSVLYDNTMDHAKIGESQPSLVSGWVYLNNRGEVAAHTYAPNGGANLLLKFKGGSPEIAWRADTTINNFILNEENESVVYAEGAFYVDAFGKSKPLSNESNGLTSVHDFNSHHQLVYGKRDSYDYLLHEIRLTNVDHPESSKFLVKSLDEEGLNESPFINLGHARINNHGKIVFMGKEGTWADRQTPGWHNMSDIYTVDAEGNWSQVKRKGSFNIIPYRPFWFNDADQVVYEAEDSAGTSRYFVTSLDGSGDTWQVGLQDDLSRVHVLDVSASGRVLFQAKNAAGNLGFYVTQDNGPAQLILDTKEALTIHEKSFLVDLRYGCLAFGSVNDHNEVVLNLPLLHAIDSSLYGNVLIHLKI